MSKHKTPVARDDSRELYATLSPDFVNNADLLQRLTHRQIAVTLGLLAMAQLERKRRISVLSNYELLGMFMESHPCGKDYRALNEFIGDIAPELQIWDYFGDKRQIRFKKRFWNQNHLSSNFVRVDIELLFSLPRTPQHLLMALLIEAWANKPGGTTGNKLLEWWAERLGMKDSSQRRLRARIESVFKDVKKVLGPKWKGLELEFRGFRTGRGEHRVYDVIALRRVGDKGRVIKSRKKMSHLIKEEQHEVARQRRVNLDEENEELREILKDFRDMPNGIVTLANSWQLLMGDLYDLDKNERKKLFAMLTPNEKKTVQDYWKSKNRKPN